MVDLCMIDLAALIEREAAVRFGPIVGQKDPTRKGGPCPFCGRGEDRFAVFVEDIPQHYFCGIHGNGCGAYGDAITFVRLHLCLDYVEACDYLGVESEGTYCGPRRKRMGQQDQPPSETWQRQALSFCLSAKEALWRPEWAPARDWYSTGRGLSPEVIDAYGLGFNPVTRWDDPAEWGLPAGKKVWLPRGFVIPYRVGGQIWKVAIRRTDKDLCRLRQEWKACGRPGAPAKYVEVSGGQQCLYGVNEIRQAQPLVLVEGPFDKLVFSQATGYHVPCVATGSTTQARGERWVEEMRQARFVLVAFDHDENQAGDQAAHAWSTLLGSSFFRLTPWKHDLCEMQQAGMDLSIWLDAGLAMAEQVLRARGKTAAWLQEARESSPIVERDLPSRCSCCGMHVEEAADFFYDGDGRPFCHLHSPSLLQEVSGTAEEQTRTPLVQLRRRAELIAAQVWPGSCQISEPMRCTPQEYIARRKAEQVSAQRRAHQPVESVARLGMPSWLIPGTAAWEAQVRRHSAAEMHERRIAWFAQHPLGPEPLPRLKRGTLAAGPP
jgi:hypothetical protein